MFSMKQFDNDDHHRLVILLFNRFYPPKNKNLRYETKSIAAKWCTPLEDKHKHCIIITTLYTYKRYKKMRGVDNKMYSINEETTNPVYGKEKRIEF